MSRTLIYCVYIFVFLTVSNNECVVSLAKRPSSRSSTPTLDNGLYSSQEPPVPGLEATASVITVVSSSSSGASMNMDKRNVESSAPTDIPPRTKPRCKDYDGMLYRLHIVCLSLYEWQYDHGIQNSYFYCMSNLSTYILSLPCCSFHSSAIKIMFQENIYELTCLI